MEPWRYSGGGGLGGAYTLTAALPGEYALTDGVPALEVLLALGGGEMMGIKMAKYLNQWNFIG